MNVLLASNNAHKYKEITGILKDRDAIVTIVRPKDLGFAFDVEETGASFADNAFLKAEALAELIRGRVHPGVSLDQSVRVIRERVQEAFGSSLPPVLADDSGICVHALDNRPGVYSARYGNSPEGPPLDDEGRNALLLRELHGVEDRTAHYVCHAVLYYDRDRYIQVQETWSGEIAHEPITGETGFGYDPIFLIPTLEQTVARIPQQHKDRISHRAKAVGTIAHAAGWSAISA